MESSLKWNSQSVIHREKFSILCEKALRHSKEVKELSGVRFCCSTDCKIGDGSCGTEVFVGLGIDGTEKAVKRLLKNNYLELAKHEQEFLRRRNAVNSKYTVKYWSLDESHDDFVFLFLNLCEETLDDFVKSRNANELRQEAPNVISDVLHGLADLHQRPEPIIHRDLKPNNILRNIDGTWLLADFGIACFLEDGDTTYRSVQRGAKDWKAPETFLLDNEPEGSNVRYKKQSDIYVAGMVTCYVVTKGQHPFGKENNRLTNLLNDKPVGLDTMEDIVLKDLLSWMLSHEPEDRPYADEALKHPYLQPPEDQFELLAKMGNEPEIKRSISSNVVKELNRDPTDWKRKMSEVVYDYLRRVWKTGKLVDYGSEWTECLRFIRNCEQHWQDKPLPRPEGLPDEPHEFFLKLFPNLPVKVHKIVRSCEWKNRRGLQKFFDSGFKRIERHDKQQPAVGHLKKRLEIAKNKDDKSEIYELSFPLGLDHCQESEFEEALKYFSLCLDVASAMKNKELEWKARREIGHVYRLKGEYSEALEHFQNCLEIALLRGNKFLQGQAHLLLGLAHRFMGKYPYAQEENEKGLKIGEDIASPYLQAQAQLAMGIVSRLMRELPEALDHYEKCMNISCRSGDKDSECSAHFGLGVTYKRQNKYSESIKHLKECLSIAKVIGNRYVVCYANLQLGNVYKLKKEYSEAKECFKKSLQAHEFRRFREEHWALGYLYSELGQREKALVHFENHLEILKSSKSRETAFAETYIYLGDIHEDLGRPDLAKQFKEKGKKIMKDRNGEELIAPTGHFEEILFDVEAIETFLWQWRQNLETQVASQESTKWEWNSQSKTHRDKFLKLRQKGQQNSKEVKEIGEVRFSCSLDCRIGARSSGTEVFVALGKDGSEKAVRRMNKNQYLELDISDKELLIARSTVNFQYTLRYWFLDVDTSPDFIYFFTDLWEETLEDFVQRSNVSELTQEAPKIIRDVLNGLLELHEGPESVIPREVKPNNILRNKNGGWLLAEFAISHTLGDEETSHNTKSVGSEFWRAAETYPGDNVPEDSKVPYKKQSDIQVVGMVAYYVVTKGQHPFGQEKHRLRNLSYGKPVGLDTLEDFVLRDLLSWMLSHKPEDRPSATQALKHPYLQHPKDQFELLVTMGNELNIKQKNSSNVIKELNRNSTDWRQKISKEQFNYLRQGRKKDYGSKRTECLRFIRNCQLHWNDIPRPCLIELPEEPHEFFLKLFPSLSVKVHKVVRNCDLKNQPNLKKFFDSGM